MIILEIELEFTIKVDGTPIKYEYKLEDSDDKDFISLLQEARMRLSHKMKTKIEGLIE